MLLLKKNIEHRGDSEDMYQQNNRILSVKNKKKEKLQIKQKQNKKI